MATEVQPAPAPPQAEEVVVTDVPQPEKPVAEAAQKEEDKAPVPEGEEQKDKPDQQVEAADAPKPDEDEKIAQSTSFKEESTKVADLPDNEKKALQELKQLVQDALNKHEFSAVTAPPQPSPPAPAAPEVPKEEEKKEATEEEKKEEKEAAEEEKKEEKTEAAEEEKKDEKKEAEEEKKDEKKEAVVAEEKKPEAQPAAEEPAKPEPAAKEPAKPEPVPEPVAETKTEPAREEKVAAVETAEVIEEKTVEAIEESVVSVSSSVQQEQPPAEEKIDAVPEEQPKEEATPCEASVQLPPEEVSIWGIPLLADERSDVILLKFLRARDFKVKDAFTMLKNTISWRKQFGIDELVEQDLGNDLEKVVFMHGFDKEGHPVCYNVYGEFQNKDLYQNTFSDEEKRKNFLKWRIQFLERSIRKLDFTPGGVSTIVQVNDLKNSPGPAKWELRQATKQALHLLQDNYPEFVAKQVFINVPWWYLAVNRMISPFLTQRTRSKFVFSGPAKSTETLLRYISAEQLPIKYGGLSKDGEFTTTDAVTEITLKPAAKHTVEFEATEACLLTWEVRVVGWDVSYGAEFVPSAEESYTVIVSKARKIASNDEPVVCNSFKIGEAGKVVLTIDNPTSKKKKLLYRLKTKPTSD